MEIPMPTDGVVLCAACSDPLEPGMAYVAGAVLEQGLNLFAWACSLHCLTILIDDQSGRLG